MERLVKLSIFSDTYNMERLIVECARNNDMQVYTGRTSLYGILDILLLTVNLQVRIDHRTRSVHFGKNLAESQKAEVAEGPHVQVSPSPRPHPSFFILHDAGLHPSSLILIPPLSRRCRASRCGPS